MSDFGRPLSEWWKRLVALIIDSVIVWVASFIFQSIVGVSMFSTGVDPTTGVPSGFSIGTFLIASLVGALIPFVYFTVMNGMPKGQTVGKMILKIQVRDGASDMPIGYGRSALRTLVPWVAGPLTCWILTLLDGLWPLWDSKREALHDKVAKSVVVDLPA